MPMALLHTPTRWLDLPKAQPEKHLALQPGQEQPEVSSQRKSMSVPAFILDTLPLHARHSLAPFAVKMNNVTIEKLAAKVDALPVPGGLKPKPAVALLPHQSAQLPSVLALQQS